jgi:hypothetical protein
MTAYLQTGGTIEHALQIANNESPSRTELYAFTNDAISLHEIERILIQSADFGKLEWTSYARSLPAATGWMVTIRVRICCDMQDNE